MTPEQYRRHLETNVNHLYGSMRRLSSRQLHFVRLIDMDGLYPWVLEVPEFQGLIVYCAAASYQSGGWWMLGYGEV